MPNLIKQGRLIQDDWQHLEQDSTSLPDGKLLLPVSIWQARRVELIERKPLGVWLNSDQPPALIGQDLQHFDLIAINFPTFADGRGYSYARTLREQYHYTGELRAIGDVLIDQLFYLQRCGFDSFQLRPDQNADLALSSLATFSESYQAASDQPLPLFRRRQ